MYDQIYEINVQQSKITFYSYSSRESSSDWYCSIFEQYLYYMDFVDWWPFLFVLTTAFNQPFII